MRKVCFVVLSFLLSLVFLLSNTLVLANEQYNVYINNTVRVRTSNTTGIQFKCYIDTLYNNPNISYGIIIGNGIIEDLNINTPNAYAYFVDEVNEDLAYFISIINFPERAYTSYLSARACLKVDNKIYYSKDTIYKNLYEVSLQALNDLEDNIIINNTVNVVENTFMQVSKISNILHIDKVRFAINNISIGSEFLNDYNMMFNTSYSYHNLSSILSINTLNLPTFFKDNNKWSWFIDYLSNLNHLDNEVKNSILSLKLGHISKDLEKITSIIKSYILSGIYDDINGYDFVNFPNDLSNVSLYNKTIYTKIKDIDLVRINEEYSLLPLEVSKNQQFLNWVDENNNVIDKVVITNQKQIYISNIINKLFNVTYEYNGGNPLYPSYDSLVNEFINDYNAYVDNIDNKISLDNLKDITDTNFIFTDVYLNNPLFKNKYKFILEYLNNNSQTLKSNTKTILNNFVTNNILSANTNKAINLLIKSFLLKTNLTIGAYYNTLDMGDTLNQENLFNYLSKTFSITKEEKGKVSLNYHIYKEGYTFKGWYIEGDVTNEIVYVVDEEVKVVALFEKKIKLIKEFE